MDIAEGSKLRFLGYGDTSPNDVTKDVRNPYIQCAESKLSLFIPTYEITLKSPKPGSNEVLTYKYSLGFAFGSAADRAYIANEWLLSHGRNAAACPGDSGGPVFVSHNGAYKLLGLISTGICDKAQTMAADLRLSSSFLLKTPVPR